MGGDDFTTAKICGEKVYKQLTELKEIVHPISNQSLTVLRRTTADGKARRAQETPLHAPPILYQRHLSMWTNLET